MGDSTPPNLRGSVSGNETVSHTINISPGPLPDIIATEPNTTVTINIDDLRKDLPHGQCHIVGFEKVNINLSRGIMLDGSDGAPFDNNGNEKLTLMDAQGHKALLIIQHSGLVSVGENLSPLPGGVQFASAVTER